MSQIRFLNEMTREDFAARTMPEITPELDKAWKRAAQTAIETLVTDLDQFGAAPATWSHVQRSTGRYVLRGNPVFGNSHMTLILNVYGYPRETLWYARVEVRDNPESETIVTTVTFEGYVAHVPGTEDVAQVTKPKIYDLRR